MKLWLGINECNHTWFSCLPSVLPRWSSLSVMKADDDRLLALEGFSTLFGRCPCDTALDMEANEWPNAEDRVAMLAEAEAAALESYR